MFKEGIIERVGRYVLGAIRFDWFGRSCVVSALPDGCRSDRFGLFEGDSLPINHVVIVRLLSKTCVGAEQGDQSRNI